MAEAELYIGVMSGTSMDAIDVVVVDFSGNQTADLAYRSDPIPEQIRRQLLTLQAISSNELDLAARMDRQLARLIAQSIQSLLKDSGLSPQQITAIGSHGQTLRHEPELTDSYTIQIGDPNTIAELTKITTVADFRRRDIAAGGQGAPLVPPFHAAVFGDNHNDNGEDRAIVNIGGMANITFLEGGSQKGKLEKPISGFDTGPGNVLLDSWVMKHKNQAYDKNGDWSKAGTVHQVLLNQLLSLPYFSAPAPKSTGREQFNLQWLESTLNDIHEDIPAVDVQATLAMLSARTISQAIIDTAALTKSVYICGGGAYNQHLCTLLTEALAPRKVCLTDTLGIKAERVEAIAFAWLARQTLLKLPGNCPSVTGANNKSILGGVYFSN